MKKFFISSIVIIAFIGYSMYQRANGSQVMPVISPKGSLSQTSPMPTSTPIPTQTPTPIPATATTATDDDTPTSRSTVSQPTPTVMPSPTPKPGYGYNDGKYVGDPADAFYGNIQVQIAISNGKITNVQFLQAPNDRGTSIAINQQADPILAQEAIQAQSANVDIVSGATDTSNAFIQSLQSALNKAKV